MALKVDISYGELLDKISILEIKLEHVANPAQRGNIDTELGLLSAARDAEIDMTGAAQALAARLRDVNQRLWNIEDDIRDCEAKGEFGSGFVELARSVYISNDERAAIKREINDLLGSPLVEEKLYKEY